MYFEYFSFVDEYSERVWPALISRNATFSIQYPQPLEFDWQHLTRASATALERVDNMGKYTAFLLFQQLALLLLVVPTMTAGAIVYEKERDTLQALFGTQLGSREIITGKILGRLILIAGVLIAALPILMLAAVEAELSAIRMLLALAQAMILAYALAGGCLLLSLWTRRTSDAIIGCYSAMVVACLIYVLSAEFVFVPAELDPVAVLSGLVHSEREIRPLSLLIHFAFWGAAGTACLVLAAARLRAVCLGQMEARPNKRLWAYRPRIGNDPIHWRERYVLGLAPVPGLRMVPRWLGRLGIFVTSAIVAGQGHGQSIFQSIWYGDFTRAWWMLRHPNLDLLQAQIHLMGAILLILGAVTLGVRSAGSIAEEKRRKTWEDLILTPLTLDDIRKGKFRGILGAAVVPVVLYAIPMFALSALGGWQTLFLAAGWVAGASIVISLAAFGGLEIATTEETTEKELELSLARNFRDRNISSNFGLIVLHEEIRSLDNTDRADTRFHA
jgi:ABC-type Na+ efflux pump permease subunit